MKHTFLFAEAEWEAEGSYFTDTGETLPASGSSIVSHGKDIWMVDGGLEVETEEGPVEFRSTYRVRPFEEGERVTEWTAENPALGLLRGVFVVLGDTILSQYRAAEEAAGGAETLRRVGDGTYEVRGLVRLGKGKVAAWALGLRRVR